MDKMISISEAGKILGVTPRTLKSGRKIKKALEELERERQVQNIN